MILRNHRVAAAAIAFTTSLTVAGPATAQTAEAPGRVRQPAPVESGQSQPQHAFPLNQNASETRREFYEVLEQYPPALGRVLRLDPTLMTNQEYLASYPAVAAFVARYPDVPRNPGYYLERYESNYSYEQPKDPATQAMRIWEDALSFLGAFTVFVVVLIALFGIIKYIVEYRRWLRISKVNTEVHNKILDRFGSNEELLAYVDSPAGRRFLESTPVSSVAAVPRPAGAPYGRMLLAVQIGVMLLALAVGFLVISKSAIDEVQPVLTSLSALAFCLGVGSIVSAAASFVLSRRLGLLPSEPAPRSEHA